MNGFSHSTPSERRLLGTILQEPLVFADIHGIVTASDFSNETHGETFRILCDLAVDNGEHDLLRPAARELEKKAILKEGEGHRFLTNLLAEASSPTDAEECACVIRGLAVRRGMMSLGEQLIADAGDQGRSVEACLQPILTRFLDLVARAFDSGVKPWACVLSDAWARLEARVQNAPFGTSGGGLDPEEFQLPPVSKLELERFARRLEKPGFILVENELVSALDLVSYVAIEKGRPTLFFCPDCSGVDVAEAILTRQTGIDPRRVREAILDENDLKKLIERVGQIRGASLLINDTPTPSLTCIAAAVTRLWRKRMIQLVIIDSLSRVQSDGGQAGSIFARLEVLARAVSVPIIGLA